MKIHCFAAQRNVLYDLVNAGNVDGLIISDTLAHSLSRRYQPLLSVAMQWEYVPSSMVDSRQGMQAVAIRRNRASRSGHREPIGCVQDNGIGIDPQYQEKVFGQFDKLDSKSEGKGIGLALVKRIIEMHGGRIWVESKGAGRGTAFCFTLGGHDG